MDISYALWGGLGAFVYAITRLIAALYSVDTPVSNQRARLVWAQFAVSMITGPIVASGFTASIVGWAWIHGVARPEAVALAVGLSANTLWPILVDGLSNRGRLIAGKNDP